MLVGRARHQASALSAELRKLGAQVIEIPFIEICQPRSLRPLDSAIRNIKSYDWLILTSVNGVEAMWDRWKKIPAAIPDNKLRIAAIGPATRKSIEDRGLKVNIVPREYVAESVVRSLKAKVNGKRVLLVRAKVARDVIPRELRLAGATVDVVEAYETVVPSSSASRLRRIFRSRSKRPHVVTFTSSSTVRNFVLLLGQKNKKQLRETLDGVLIASIGPVTSATLLKFGLPTNISPKEFTIPALVSAIADAIKSKNV